VLKKIGIVSVLGGLYHRANALGAQHALHFAPVFDDRYGLQIRTEDPPRGFIRPGTIVTEGGRLTAVCALCHHNILSWTAKRDRRPRPFSCLGCPSRFRKYQNHLSGAILPQTVSFYKISG
jgi:hypothetical protein